MNRREIKIREKIEQRKKYKKKKIHMVNALLIIISILLLGMLSFYLKGTNNPNKYEIKENKIIKEHVEKEILISFAGDFTLGTDTKLSYDSSLPAAFINNGKNYSYFLQNVSEIFSKDDYTLVNLETTFTDSNVKSHKEESIFFNFKGPKEYVNILTSASIDGVTIANNHIYDYGNQGINDTINILKENKIDICGEGYKILKNIKGIKFGFLGYTGWEFSEDLKAKIVKDINELRNQGAEIVIPYFHWGIEKAYKPCDVQKKLARFSIDNGADAVIGSHPHVIQSIENYRGKLIVYSMGNFCFGGNPNPPDKRTFILQLKADIKDNKLNTLEYKIIPAMISSKNYKNDYIPTLATGENKTNILNKLNELSPTLDEKIKDDFFSLDFK